jgi:hypothetical protein
MRVLKTDMRKIDFCKFFQFSIFFFSVERLDGLSWRPDGLVVRTVLSWSPDGNGVKSSGRDLLTSDACGNHRADG